MVTVGEKHLRKWKFREGFKKGFKMSDIYPDREIIVSAAKPSVGHKSGEIIKSSATVAEQQPAHEFSSKIIPNSKYNVGKIIRKFTIPGIVVASIFSFILFKYYFKQTASEWLNKVLCN